MAARKPAATASATKHFKFPKSLPDCIKRLRKLQDAVDEVRIKCGPMIAEEEALREFILENFKKTELDGASAHGISLSITKTTAPTMEDFQKFIAFVVKTKSYDLLQHSVNTPAWRERLAAKKQVPGVGVFDRIGLRVSRVKAGGK